MPQDVHHPLARVGTGGMQQVQQPAAVGVEAALMVRVPGLDGHPAGAVGLTKGQLRLLHFSAGINAVACTGYSVEFSLGQVGAQILRAAGAALLLSVEETVDGR